MLESIKADRKSSHKERSQKTDKKWKTLKKKINKRAKMIIKIQNYAVKESFRDANGHF